MSVEGKLPQMTGQPELPLANRGETPRGKRSEEAPTAAHGDERSGESDLMEKACERRNLLAALKRVRKNKGSPGIDRMTVDELPGFLREHWPRLREQLLDGTYQPAAVKCRTVVPSVCFPDADNSRARWRFCAPRGSASLISVGLVLGYRVNKT